MFKSTSKNNQRRREAGLQAMPRPDSTALFRKERQRAERAAKKEAKKGPMRRLKDTWDE